jgi:sirohydrochlorin ferrochelatase
MNRQKYKSMLQHCCRLALGVLLAASIKSGLAEETLSRKERQTGFLVVAADRGFLGNEEIADEFQLFAQERNAALVFVTDERTQKYLEKGVDRLLQRGAERIVTIPLFISSADPRYELARQLLQREKTTIPVTYTPPYGNSVFAVEALADKLRAVRSTADTGLIIVGYGAVDNDSEQGMLADWKRIVENAAAGFGFSSISVLIARDSRDEAEEFSARLKQELAVAAAHNGSKTTVVPFHLGPRLDSMMSFDAKLKWLLPPGAQLLSGGNPDTRPDSRAGSIEDAFMITGRLAGWLRRQANLNQALADEDIGVVFLSHGSDFNWNQAMRDAVQPLTKRYKIEFAFSMADQATIERAIRKLEQRGAKAAVIVRVFGMKDSFRMPVERMVGLDVEDIMKRAVDIRAEHGHGHGGAAGVPSPRILTSLPIRTAGGLESSPLFAAALLDRARAASRNPACDTVILVAHGSGSDRQNDHWNKVLEEIAAHMQKAGGGEFHAIKVATWREDWPEKRAPWIDKIRNMVEDARKNGGRAIVIPARTTGQGPEEKFLSGLEYELGSGFAPHPLFVQWVEEQIKTGLSQLAERGGAEMATEKTDAIHREQGL